MNQALQDRKLGSTENDKVMATGGRMSGCGVQPLLTLSWSLSLPTSLVNQVNSSRRWKSHEVSLFFFFKCWKSFSTGILPVAISRKRRPRKSMYKNVYFLLVH